MRITEGMMLLDTRLDESGVTSRLATFSQQASTGLRVAQPSDDPAAFATIQQQQAQLSIVQARSSTATQAAGDLSLSEGLLDSASNLVSQAQSIAVEASNGTQDAASRANSALQISSIFQQVLAIANSRGSTGYLFGGTATQTAPFDSTGTFQGNTGVTHVEIADGVLAVSNANGSDAFTASGGTDIFATLGALQAALQNDDVAGIQAASATLGSAETQVIGARVQTGVDAGRLTSSSTMLTNTATQIQIAMSSTRDADLPSTLSNLQQTQTAYEAALQVNKELLATALGGFGGGG